MKAKCIDNLGVERSLTQGKIYEVEHFEHDQNFFTMIGDDLVKTFCYKSRFEVVPSIDDVIKDKEREKRANVYQKIIDYKNQNKEKRTMNGLEAIKVMMEGKIVTDGTYLYKEIDGDICFKGQHATEYSVDNEFNFALDYKEYFEPKLTGWERVDEGAATYFISVYEGVKRETERWDDIDVDCYEIANYFSTREKAEEINFKQTLFRKLQRFSDENGGTEIDWNDENQSKFSIKYSHWPSELSIDCYNTIQQFGQVYFASKDVARKAIELFHDDLIKYFTGDFGGNQ